MAKFIDITGQRFGLLVAEKPVGTAPGAGTLWQCKCDCGRTPVVYGRVLRGGITRSCGCKGGGYKHGYARDGLRHPSYIVWIGMLERCNNPNHLSYKNYGGRGIKVCKRWLDFTKFLQDMGERPSPELQIDRIDNDGNYEPGNCKWSTRKEQTLSRRPRETSDGRKTY